MAETHLHLCAHLGDELRYFTPGLAQSARSAARTVVVYLTDAGECAAEARSNRPESASGPAADRHGVRRALAQLATGDPERVWNETVLDLPTLPGAETAELDNVLLIFIGLRPAEADQQGLALDGLWRGETETLLGPGGAIRRSELIDALASLFDRIAPSAVHLLDPDAEHLGFDDRGAWIRTDDLDHIASALFGLAALDLRREQVAEAEAHRYVVECHRARTAERWPEALSPSDARERAELLALATGVEPEAEGHGGLQRFTPSTQWLTLGGDSQLFAVAPVGGRLAAWRRPTAGSGSWETVALPALEFDGGFAPVAETVTALDGRVYVFGQRLALAESDHEHGRGILVSRQSRDGGAFTPWTELGGPSGNTTRDSMRRRLLGSPRGTVALADGGVQFFARNAGNGVSSRRIAFGRGWSHWLDFGGDGADGASAVSALDGMVDIAAPGDRSIRHWIQDGPLGQHTRDSQVDTPVTATALTLVDLGNGNVALLTRESPSVAVAAYLCPQGAPWTSAKPVRLGDVGGHGPVAAALNAGGSRLALATRSAEGNAAYAWWDWTTDAAPVWRTAGPAITGAPALALDADGVMVLAVHGTDGAVHAGTLAEQDQPEEPHLQRVG